MIFENMSKKRSGCKLSYGTGLFTLFSNREGGEPLEIYYLESPYWDNIKQQYIYDNPREVKVIIVWIGIRASDRTATYILKDNTGEKYWGIKDKYLKTNEGKISLSKYLKLK